MTAQHCGRPDQHDEHTHTARERRVVVLCNCGTKMCTCPEVVPERMPTRVFVCSGRLTQEGAPAWLPVEVGV